MFFYWSFKPRRSSERLCSCNLVQVIANFVLQAGIEHPFAVRK